MKFYIHVNYNNELYIAGNLISEVCDDAIAGSSILGLETFGNTLVVPNCKQLLFYKINM